MRDIARAAGVSQSTVSRILNDVPLVVPVSPATRTRVVAAAAELAYHPNPLARGLRGGRTMLLGAIVRDITDPFFAGAIDALTSAARKRGYSVVLGHAHAQADEALALAAVLEARPCDAIVIVGDMRNQPQLIQDLENVRIRVVALWQGQRHDGFLTVNVDNRGGIEAALDHLTALGHRRIAFVGDPVHGDIQERRSAFEEYLARLGVELPAGYVQSVRNTAGGGEAALERLVELADPPTAVVAATDVLAIGILHGAFERGVGVPDALSVVGFDDIPFAAATVPALTTVRMPVAEMVEAAVELAVDTSLRADAEASDVQIFSPSLVVRRSTTARRSRGG